MQIYNKSNLLIYKNFNNLIKQFINLITHKYNILYIFITKPKRTVKKNSPKLKSWGRGTTSVQK